MMHLLLAIDKDAFKNVNLKHDAFLIKGGAGYLLVTIKKGNGVTIKSRYYEVNGELQPYPGARKIPTAIRVKAIKVMQKAGFNNPEIAEMMDISLMTIYRDIRLTEQKKIEKAQG